jgi:hypothetical protein
MSLFDMLNTPRAVAAALAVVLAVNAFLFFGVYSPKTAPAAQRSTEAPVERVGAVAAPGGAPGAPEEIDPPAGGSQYDTLAGGSQYR